MFQTGGAGLYGNQQQNTGGNNMFANQNQGNPFGGGQQQQQNQMFANQNQGFGNQAQPNPFAGGQQQANVFAGGQQQQNTGLGGFGQQPQTSVFGAGQQKGAGTGLYSNTPQQNPMAGFGVGGQPQGQSQGQAQGHNPFNPQHNPLLGNTQVLGSMFNNNTQQQNTGYGATGSNTANLNSLFRGITPSNPVPTGGNPLAGGNPLVGGNALAGGNTAANPFATGNNQMAGGNTNTGYNPFANTGNNNNVNPLIGTTTPPANTGGFMTGFLAGGGANTNQNQQNPFNNTAQNKNAYNPFMKNNPQQQQPYGANQSMFANNTQQQTGFNAQQTGFNNQQAGFNNQQAGGFNNQQTGFNTQPQTGFNTQPQTGFNTQPQTALGGTSWGVPTNNAAGMNKPFTPFTPLKPKNNKIDGKHVVKCITLLDENTGFCKNELRMRFLMGGGNSLMAPPVLAGGPQAQTNTGGWLMGGNNNNNTGGGLAGGMNANNNNMFANIQQNQPQTGGGWMTGNTNNAANTGNTSFPGIGTPVGGTGSGLGMGANNNTGGGLGFGLFANKNTAATTPTAPNNPFASFANNNTNTNTTTPAPAGNMFTGLNNNNTQNTGNLFSGGWTNNNANNANTTNTANTNASPIPGNPFASWGSPQQQNNNQAGGFLSQATPNFMGQNNTQGMQFGTTPQQQMNSGFTSSYTPIYPPGLLPNMPVTNPVTGQQFASVFLNGLFNAEFFKQMVATINRSPFEDLVSEVKKKNVESSFKQNQSSSASNRLYGLDDEFSVGYIPRYNKYNKAMYGSSINFNHNPYLHNDYTQDQLDYTRQAEKLREKFLSKNDRFEPKPAPSSRRRDPQPLLSKGFTQQLVEKATAPSQQASAIRRIVVNQEDLPVLSKGYKITPSIAKLKQKTQEQLKKVPNVTIENQFGKIIFKQPINLYQKKIAQCVEIIQDSIDIMDSQWESKKCDLIFKNFGRWTELKNNEDKNKIERKMKRWIQKNNMNEKSFDRSNGQLHVEIY